MSYKHAYRVSVGILRACRVLTSLHAGLFGNHSVTGSSELTEMVKVCSMNGACMGLLVLSLVTEVYAFKGERG